MLDAAPHITVYRELAQGSEEWLAARCGMLTASEMKLILTPTLKAASNDKERGHVYELAAQRISGYVEPHYISDDMLRGQAEEIEARRYYEHNFAAVEQVGFIVNTSAGFPIGCSPDGLVGNEGGLEIKSRRQKFQIETITSHVPAETIPPEFAAQVQTCLLVTERKWWDFVSFSGGLPMAPIRVYPDPIMQEAIQYAAWAFEKKVREVVAKYHEVTGSPGRLIPTERILFTEILA